jgi:hypothetical protein
MKRTVLLASISCLLTLLPANLPAQDPEEVVHAPDLGEFMLTTTFPPSIPHIPNAPFTATFRFEVIRRLEDGSTIVRKNHCLAARDSTGRTFREGRFLTPDDDKRQSPLRQIVFVNPVSHERYACDPQGRVCRVSPYYEPPSHPLSPYMGGNGHTTHVPLGVSRISGVEAVGSRDLTTIPAEQASTNRPITLSTEYWYSQQLGMSISIKHFDPRTGTEIFLVDQLILGEPNPTLFEVPKGARILGDTVQAPN